MSELLTEIPLDRMLLTIEGVADMLGFSQRTIRRMDLSGKLPQPVMRGRRLRWNRQEVVSWVGHGCPSRVQWQPIWSSIREMNEVVGVVKTEKRWV